MALFNMEDEELDLMNGLPQLQELPSRAPAVVEEPDYKALAIQSVKDKYGIGMPKEELSLPEDTSGPNFAAGAAALGAGLQGRDAAAAGKAFLDLQNKERLASRGPASKAVDPDEADPMSVTSKTYQALAKKLLPNSDVDFSQLPAAKIKQLMPSLQAMVGQNLRSEEIEARKRDQDLNRDLKMAALAQSKEAKSASQQELSSTQAKQKGLYDIGSLAEEQYKEATKDANAYDPTSYGEFLDSSGLTPNFLKSNEAIKARSAQDSWIESFLRDASGAAIPESERDAYRGIYFPVKGDTPDVVANKERLRMQKAESARIASGPGAKQSLPKPSMAAPAMSEKITVSNGKKSFKIDASKLADAEKDGFKRVQ